MSFDKNKPYGEIFGSTENGARYLQDGVYYDISGKEVDRIPEDVTLVQKKASKPKAAPRPTVRVTGRTALPGTQSVVEENRKALAVEDLAE